MLGQIIPSLLSVLTLIYLCFFLQPDGKGVVAHLNALIFVVGGTLCVTLFNYRVKKLVWMIRVIKRSFASQDGNLGTIQAITLLARQYRGGGDIRNLEKQVADLPPGLLRTGVELIAYDYHRDKMERILRREISCVQGQYESVANLLHNLSQILPSIGLIGTLLHFIRCFGLSQNLQELAGNAAVAFLTAFYGVLLGRLGLVALIQRLREFMQEERFRMDLVQEGILDVREGEHPRALQFKLESRISAREPYEVLGRRKVVPEDDRFNLQGGRVDPVLNH